MRRKEADARSPQSTIEEKEALLRRIVNTIPAMAWSFRPDGVVDFLNQRWTDYTGLPLERYVENPLGPIHPMTFKKRSTRGN